MSIEINNVQFTTTDEDHDLNTTTKCGDILLTGTGAFNYICSFCGENSINMQYFTNHLYNNHFVTVGAINNTTSLEIQPELLNINLDNINNDIIIEKYEIDVGQQQQQQYQQPNTEQVEVPNEIILNENVSNRPFKCQFCNRGLTSEKHLKNHTARCSQRKFDFKCKQCPRTFMDQFKYDRHIQIEHDNKSKKLIKEIIVKSSGLKPFKCSICNKGFLTVKSARCHKTRCLQRDIPFKCQFCPRKFFESIQCEKHERFKHHLDKKSDIPYGFWKCKICNRLLSKSYSRKRHEESHSSLVNRNEKRCSCTLCGKEVSSATALRVHMRTHSEERPLKCPFCPASFKYSTSLKTHETSHTGERKFQCQFCEKRFLTNTHKKNHEMLHSKEKNYKCDNCDMKFVRKDYLDSHNRHKHKNDDTRPFKCPYSDCSSAFTTDKYLKNHQRLHENGMEYSCQYCDKKHVVKGLIERHELTHFKIKESLNCEICPKSFASRSGLQLHMKNKHPDNAPIQYKCGKCDDEFPTKGDLQMHIKNICSIVLKLFACNMCSSRFTTEYGLRCHRGCLHPGYV